VLERTGYLERLAIDGSPEARGRAENLMELVASLQDYERRTEQPTLVEFLEQVALTSDVDTYSEHEGQVTLMTVHSAKGLEFPVVFIVGLEQGIFPHSRSLNDYDQMEEERRLAYVAITRARERLYLSHATSRWVFNQPQENDPSEFLTSIPEQLLAASGPMVRRAGRRGWSRPYRRSGASTRARAQGSEVWIDRSYDQSTPDEWDGEEGFQVGMHVRHPKFGVGEIRGITGSPPNQNLTIFFNTVGSKTIRGQFVRPV
jgi:DNA helicase-2/ATP-dependent DNA helicase PcrA